MTDIEKIAKVIQKINRNCCDMDTQSESLAINYQSEKKAIDQKASEMINDMKSKYNAFKTQNFIGIKNKIEQLVSTLSQDYADEWNKATLDSTDYTVLTYEENEARLYTLTEKINEYIDRLNSVDFDKLVPPVSVNVSGESFTVCTDSGNVVGRYDYNSDMRQDTNDPKPIRDIVRGLYPYCKEAVRRIDALMAIYDRNFNINGFDSFVNSSAATWLAERKAEFQAKYDERFNALFINEKADAVPNEFFVRLAEEGKASEVDPAAGTSSYNESMTIGNMRLLVENQPRHLKYINESPVLRKYLPQGRMSAPLILNLKECGNVLLNVDEDNYSNKTIAFVNQLIIQFLLSFPANRINFCLIDIDNKMEFSPFKSLTKINNGILFNGIIRDDRQLENTIKDVEQTMYKIKDDILSCNNVEDVYEYNKRFEASPQSMHLFVLVNFPSGMRDDTAKRVAKIIQNGNKAGIFSIIVNNKACSLSPGYKPAEYAQFIENAGKHSVVIDKQGNSFTLHPDTLNMNIENEFVPKNDISISSLSSIVEIMKGNAESNRQKVVPLSQMFADTDIMERSAKGIPSSAEVLDIPIGAKGGEIQNLLLKTTGDGSAHAVVIGGTGSGKSNLLHTIIMSACYKYSPEELNLYLIDFKGGVEFKYYEANKVREKQMPHIKLTGLTSDLEDGVAILNNLQRELRSREDEFRKCGVEDIVQYRNLGKKKPRLFVIIDEIQELFEQDSRLGEKAIDILRELFKKGRAFGINILWASQNIPSAPGLKDKVLSQIGNRISLRLNEPDDAMDIKIDPKVVRNLNRPEKGLGVINDIRYGNDSIEFRVAYAETSENRQKYSQEIIDKWRKVSDPSDEPLFIVGDDDEPSPVIGNTIYTTKPSEKQVVSKSFDSYTIQIGQDYVTGKPYNIDIALRENKMNLILAGYDTEMLRDMMGYSLLSVLINQITNADCISEGTKIYYANGEMINPKNSDDLFNVIRSDFSELIENISSTEKFVSCIKDTYKLYKERSIDADNSEYAKVYTPRFVVIHSMQRYIDLFNANPVLKLTESTTNADEQTKSFAPAGNINLSSMEAANNYFVGGKRSSLSSVGSMGSDGSKMPDMVYLSDAFKELLDRGGKFGIHFIISIDNPFGITAIKNDVPETAYKVFVKGINANVLSQLLGNCKAISNPKIALVSVRDEYAKIRVYRYEAEQDHAWYKKLCDDYGNLFHKFHSAGEENS